MDEGKRPRGRPPGVKRPKKVYTYLTEDELRVLESLAKSKGLGLAALMRTLVLEAAKKEGIE